MFLYIKAARGNTFCLVYFVLLHITFPLFSSLLFSSLLFSSLLFSSLLFSSVPSRLFTSTYVCTFQLSLSLHLSPDLLQSFSLTFSFSSAPSPSILFATTCLLPISSSSRSCHSTSFNYIHDSHHYLPLSYPYCQPCFFFSTQCLCLDGEALGQAKRQAWLGLET